MAGAKKTQGAATVRDRLNWRAHLHSRLLSPDSCISTNEGTTGDVIENTRSGTRDTRIRDTEYGDSVS
jgi:hypothetical protein